MKLWNLPPPKVLPDTPSPLVDGNGTILLCLVGAIAATLIAYLVYDYIQCKRRERRFEERRQASRRCME